MAIRSSLGAYSRSASGRYTWRPGIERTVLKHLKCRSVFSASRSIANRPFRLRWRQVLKTESD
jgi:hypothetical protein